MFHPHFLVSGNLVYEPRRRHEAKCGTDHLAPDEKCSCGIYAFKTQEEFRKQQYNVMKRVVGEVWLWGRIVEHEAGYRAQFAYPKRLWIANRGKGLNAYEVDAASLAPYIGYVYGVPCELVDPGHDVVKPEPQRRAAPRPAQPMANPTPSKKHYYSVTTSGLTVKHLPPQALTLLRIIARLMKDDDPVPEKKFVEAVMAAGKSGELKTRQHPWHIFCYYKGRLVRDGYIVVVKGKDFLG